MNNLKTTFNYDFNDSDNKFFNKIKTFAVSPFYWGTFVFAIFFSVILLTKLFSYFISEHSIFSLNIYDILFSMIGFGIGFIIEFSVQIRKELQK